MKLPSAIDMDSLLAELNEQQRMAVTHLNGPLLVLAGAGTGKTRVISTRIANLMTHGVKSDGIVALTFTKKAAGEMNSRLREIVGDEADKMNTSTFHSLGLSILRENHNSAGLNPYFEIISGKQRMELCEQVFQSMEKHFFDAPDVKHIEALELSRLISLAKNCGIDSPRLKRSEAFNRMLRHAFDAYNEKLRRADAIDFDDMVFLPVEFLESDSVACARYKRRFRHILIDEYQDTNTLQYRLVKCLLNVETNLCVVGDDDQSIYGFRGANRELILNFRNEFPNANVVKLVSNYRCSREIIGVANAVIKESPGRYDKQLVASRGQKGKVRFHETRDSAAESDFIGSDIKQTRQSVGRPFDAFAVLVRGRRDVEQIRHSFQRLEIPIGTTRNGINLLTLHASKGLEFPHVYLAGVNDDNLPHWNASQSGQADVEEERRLFYVGITRAEEQLTLTSVKRRGQFTCQPSRFARDLIETRLVEHLK